MTKQEVNIYEEKHYIVKHKDKYGNERFVSEFTEKWTAEQFVKFYKKLMDIKET